MSDKILGIATLLYLFLCFTHLLYFVLKKERIISFIWIILWTTLGLLTAGLVAAMGRIVQAWHRTHSTFKLI